MSHSQWEKKKYKKAASEGKTSQIYAKLVKLIIMEAKKANGNRESSGLKAAINKARSADMPVDNIERAIKKATEPGVAEEIFTYEGYGKGGVGFIVEVLTNNRNKSAQEMKFIFSKNGGALGAINSVSWAFSRIVTDEGEEWQPQTLVPFSESDKKDLESLINDLENNEDVQNVYHNGEGLE